MTDAGSPQATTARELEIVLAAERRGEPFVLYRGADGAQQLVVLESGYRPITIGRSLNAEIPLSWDGQVSRLHCELECVAGEWIVVDDGLSSNGTYLNGDNISGRRRLHDGDEVRVGRTTLLFRAPSEAASSKTTKL